MTRYGKELKFEPRLWCKSGKVDLLLCSYCICRQLPHTKNQAYLDHYAPHLLEAKIAHICWVSPTEMAEDIWELFELMDLEKMDRVLCAVSLIPIDWIPAREVIGSSECIFECGVPTFYLEKVVVCSFLNLLFWTTIVQ